MSRVTNCVIMVPWSVFQQLTATYVMRIWDATLYYYSSSSIVMLDIQWVVSEAESACTMGYNNYESPLAIYGNQQLLYV